MQVLLYDHVAPTGKRGILLADDGGVDSSLFHRVLRPIDEADQVAIIEVVEAVHFIHRGNCAAEPRHDLCRQFEAQVHARCTDMKKDITRRCRSMMLPADFTEWMQMFRLRHSEEPVPCV